MHIDDDEVDDDEVDDDEDIEDDETDETDDTQTSKFLEVIDETDEIRENSELDELDEDDDTYTILDEDELREIDETDIVDEIDDDEIHNEQLEIDDVELFNDEDDETLDEFNEVLEDDEMLCEISSDCFLLQESSIILIEQYVQSDETDEIDETEIEATATHDSHIDVRDEIEQIDDVLYSSIEIQLNNEQSTIVDEIDDCDDEHMLVIIADRQFHIELQVEAIEQLEVVKFADLHIKK